MRNYKAKFVRILGFCKDFTENSVTELFLESAIVIIRACLKIENEKQNRTIPYNRNI